MGSTVQSPSMPSKCPFYHPKYTISAACEKHLPSAHAGLDIVLASTIQYIIIEPSILHNPEASERQDSNYECDPGPARGQPDELCCHISYQSDTEVLDGTVGALAGKQICYEVAGGLSGEVHGFEDEHSNLCDDPWAPCNSTQDFKLAC